MDINIKLLNSIVKEFVKNEGVNNVPIIIRDDTALEYTYSRASNTISIGDALIYSMVPNIVFPYNHCTLQRLLFFKYWSFQHISNFRFNIGIICLLKLLKYANSKSRKLYCSASHLYINEINTFCLLHETTHACFKSSKEYADRENEAIKTQFSEYKIDQTIQSLPLYVRKEYSAFIKDSQSRLFKFSEELASDAKALKYIFNSPNFFKPSVSKEEKQVCAKQILNTIVVQEYSHLMGTLSEFQWNAESFTRHNIRHFYSVFRISSAVMVLSDLLETPSKDYKNSIRSSHKLLKGFNLLNIFDVKYSIADEADFDFDIDKRDDLLKQYREAVVSIGKWMLGEEIADSLN